MKIPLLGLLLLPSLVGSPTRAEEGPVCPKTETLSRASFPEGFMFGTATASYQVEGAVNEGCRGPNLWDLYTKKFPHRVKNHNADEAVDFYHRYKEDIKLMKKLNTDAFRLSIAWPRIFPHGRMEKGISKEGVQFYHDLIDKLLKNDITPLVTAFHWDIPADLEDEYGGFLSERVVRTSVLDLKSANLGVTLLPLSLFRRLPEALSFEDMLSFDLLCTVRFLSSVVSLCLCGAPAPVLQALAGSRCKEFKPLPAVHESRSSPLAFPLVGLDQQPQLLQSSVTYTLLLNCNYIQTGFCGVRKLHVPRIWGQSEKLDYVQRAMGLQPFRLRKHRGVVLRTSKILDIFAKMDGQDLRLMSLVTIYSLVTLKPLTLSESAKSTAKMAVYAAGLRKLVKYIKDRYGNPEIIITENGYGEDLGVKDTDHSVALNDHNRKYYHQRHLLALHQAICEDKVNVTSYFVWSLMDNFEWQDGYTARFGLYYIDFKNSLTRMEKESAKWFTEFLKPGPKQKSSKSTFSEEL
ncbi:hypothetical protein YC2023_057676 [Brassica napus]